MKRNLTIFGILVLVLALMTGAASAQDDDGFFGSNEAQQQARDGFLRDALEIITEATGLSNQDLLQAAREGSTLAEIITENGGDVDAITAEIIALANTRIDDALADGSIDENQAAQLRENLETRIDSLLNRQWNTSTGRLGQRQERSGPVAGLLREAVSIISDVTGLNSRDLLQAAREGSTLAEIITENGGDVDAITADIVTAVTEQVNEFVAQGNLTQEQADELLANLEQTVTDLLNGELNLRTMLGSRDQGGIRAGMQGEMLGVITEATGLTRQDIVQELRGGATLAEIITENGGDVQAVTDTIVANVTQRVDERVAEGALTQEQADELLANLEQLVTDVINGEQPLRNR